MIYFRLFSRLLFGHFFDFSIGPFWLWLFRLIIYFFDFWLFHLTFFFSTSFLFKDSGLTIWKVFVILSFVEAELWVDEETSWMKFWVKSQCSWKASHKRTKVQIMAKWWDDQLKWPGIKEVPLEFFSQLEDQLEWRIGSACLGILELLQGTQWLKMLMIPSMVCNYVVDLLDVCSPTRALAHGHAPDSMTWNLHLHTTKARNLMGTRPGPGSTDKLCVQ